MLEAVPTAQLARARAAWPTVSIPEEVFRAYVAERPGDGEPRYEELYLACACSRGDAAAVAAFAAAYGPTIAAAVRRVDAPRERHEEAAQHALERLLVAAPGESPRIAQYSGRSELAAFVRVVAVRVALDLVRGERRNMDGDDVLESMSDGRDDPELQYLKVLYRQQFRAAFATALQTLSARDRSLLRYQIVEGLDLERIAAIHGRPRSTMGRHVLEARSRLVAATRAELRAQLAIDREELDSVLRLVQSSVDVSVRRLLGQPAVAGSAP